MRRKHVPALTARARELRQNMTREERRLWYDFLKNYPVRFLRQKVIDGYIVDFYCARAKIAIELDGSQHYMAEGQAYDEERDRDLAVWGIQVVRFPNSAVSGHFADVCGRIDQIVTERLKQ